MKKFIKNTANSIRTKAIRLAATRRSGEGYICLLYTSRCV